MEPIAAITTAISGIKTATDIAQFLKTVDQDYAAAEYRIQLAEMMNSLADTKIAIAELKEVLAEKDSEIKRLQEKITTLENDSDKLMRKHGLYYADGDPEPFCPNCYESEGLKLHLKVSDSFESSFGPLRCTKCGTFFSKK